MLNVNVQTTIYVLGKRFVSIREGKLNILTVQVKLKTQGRITSVDIHKYINRCRLGTVYVIIYCIINETG